MTKEQSDLEILERIRVALDQYFTGETILQRVVDAGDVGIRELRDCRPELVEQMRQELKVIKRISSISQKGAEITPMSTHYQDVEDAVTILARLVWEAMRDVDDDVVGEGSEEHEDPWEGWGY